MGPSSIPILGRSSGLDECEARNWEIDNMDVISEAFNSKGIIEDLQIYINTLGTSKNENHGLSSLRT